jgi:sulfur carrier protein
MADTSSKRSLVTEPPLVGPGAGPASQVCVWVNGEKRLLATMSLEQALIELGYGGLRVATALNGAFVAAAARGETVLGESDRLEIVSPRQGG